MTDNFYNVKLDKNRVHVTRSAVADLAKQHKAKTWTQLSTPDKLDLIALYLGLINKEGEIICLAKHP